MSAQHDLINEVADCLLNIEMEMRRLNVWSHQEPSRQALASTEPFCLDTLEFTEWLQFVFLIRMKVIVEQGDDLSRVSGVAPMAEEYFRARPESGERLVQELATVDRLLSDS